MIVDEEKVADRKSQHLIPRTLWSKSSGITS